MNSVNVNISVTNVPQFDRHQSDIHRNPIVNQQQNTQLAREDLAQRAHMAVQPDSVDNKVVDPNDKNKQQQDKRKKRKQQSAENKTRSLPRSRDSGGIVDLEA